MTERVCDWCGKKFNTLSKARLHDCPQKHEKMTEELTLQELTYTKEDDPLAVFTVEIPEGEEWGAYQLALGVATIGGEDKFVFLDGNNNYIAELDPEPDVIEWLDRALDTNCYVTATNYQPAEDYGHDDIDYFAASGRSLGAEFDHLDREEFTDENRRRVKQVREKLAGPRGKVGVGEVNDSPNYRAPLDTSGAEPVIEFIIAGNPDREARVLDTKENVRGMGKVILGKHGFVLEENRPINVVPLTPDIGRRYVRVIFDDQEQAVQYFETFETIPESEKLFQMLQAVLEV